MTIIEFGWAITALLYFLLSGVWLKNDDGLGFVIYFMVGCLCVAGYIFIK